jgi:glutathione S-transferase
MTNLAGNPTFTAYAVSLLVLSANLLFLWAYSGGVRGRTKTTPNPEDAGKRSQVLEKDPPEVARVLRAYANAAAATLPFAILGLVYVLAGGASSTAIVIFGIFTVARLAHAVTYLGGKQPWRTISFGVGALATVALMASIVRTLLEA